MKSFFVLILITMTLSISAQKLTVVGNYSEHVVSMCAQGCVFYEIGILQLTAPLDINETAKLSLIHHKSVTVISHGEVKTVEVLPTVAGPQSDGSGMGEYEKAERFFPEDFTLITVCEPEISAKDFEAFSAGTDYEVILKVTNPTDKVLKLKAKIESGEFRKFTLPANGTAEVVVPVKHDGWSSRLRLTIMEQVVDDEDVYRSAHKQGLASGLLFYVEHYIEIKELPKR